MRFYVHTFLCEVLCTYIFVYLVKRGVLSLVSEIRRPLILLVIIVIIIIPSAL